jgi:hypothetical protein
MNKIYDPPYELRRIRGVAIGVGLIGILIWVIAAIVSGNAKDTFFQSYLVAFIFWCGISLGCLGWLMIQYLGGASWGVVIRRMLESGAHALVLMMALFLPIAFLGLHSLYEWADLNAVAGSKVLQQKSLYLNTGFFIVRTFIYFTIWLTLLYYLRRWSTGRDGRPGFHSVRAKPERPGVCLLWPGRHVCRDRLDYVARRGMVLDDLRFDTDCRTGRLVYGIHHLS